MAKVQITDTILRDGHQSQAATRMRTDEMLPACEMLDKVGYYSLECWGGATYDACLRFLNEDPWERLRKLRKALPNTKLQMLLRGQNLLGYRPYADDVVDFFVKKAVENGIDIIRCFDALNDLRNMQTAVKATKKYGGTAEIAMSYTESPVHNEDYFVKLAVDIQKMGADVICIDGYRGGTGAAPTRIRDNVGIPIELALAAVDQRLRDEGIRDQVSVVVGGSIRNSADLLKAIALGADACYIATSALLAMGCHLCRTCQTGKCNWGIATQRPDLVKRLNPDIGYKRLVNLVTAWEHEIKEMMGGMGINSIEALRGNRLMLRGVGLNEKELQILGIKHAGE